MGILDKLFGRVTAPPPWAGFFTAEEYARFVAVLQPALTARGLPTDTGSLRGGVLPARIGSEDSALGLAPIARRCHGADEASWAALIEEHLARALESQADTRARLAADFEAARSLLKVQLMPERARRADWEEGLNYQVFAPGVLAVLNYDLPTVVHSVPAADVRGWGRAPAELWAIATENVRAEVPPPEREVLDVGGHRVEQLTGDSYFVCSHALWLDAPEDTGLLVAVPSRHIVLFQPVGPRDLADEVEATTLAAIDVLSQLAHRLYATVPGPVSSEVFWRRGALVERVPVVRGEEGVEVLLPEGLQAIIGGG